MSNTPPATDRFDAVTAGRGRVGAHRAENPRLISRALLFWAAVATVVLVAAGIFGTLVATGRIAFDSAPASTATAPPPADSVPAIDTSYSVLVLNATTQGGLAGEVRDEVIAAGWSSEAVEAGDAAASDFPATTVYFPFDEAEGAARGLAEALGGADVAFSDAYQPADDDQLRQLVVVVGMDREAGAESENAPSL